MTAPTRRLRVGYVSTSLDIGGAERQMVALAERLPKERFEIEFVLFTHKGPLADAAEAAGVRAHVVGWARRKSRLHWLHWPWDLVKLAWCLRRGRYSIVDARLFHAYGLSALVMPAARFPVLISGRRALTEINPSGPIERILDALARRRSDALVAVAEAVRDDVARNEHIDPARIRVIRNGVLIPPPMPPAERTAIRAGWGFGPVDLVVGAVANLKRGKGLEHLLRVVAKLRSEVPSMRLVIVGEGPLRPVLEALVTELVLGDVVRLHGLDPDARRLYGAFDIFAHASESEGSSNAVLEAAAAALPIVATRAGGTGEAIVDGESGLLVPVNDNVALSAALLRVAQDPDLGARLGAAARKRVATVFGMERMVAEFAALYEELAERKGIGQ